MKSLNDLLHETQVLKLVKSGVHGRYTKEMLMDMLAACYRKRDVDRPELIPQHPVMLARNVKDLKPNIFEGMRKNENGIWIAEEKLDEMRAKWHLGGFTNRIDSRNRSDVTYEYADKTNSLPHLRDLPHELDGTLLDGGLCMPIKTINDGKTQTTGWLTTTTAVVNSKPQRAIELQKRWGWCRYFIYDILFYCGSDVRALKYEERYKLVKDVWQQLQETSQAKRIQLPIHEKGAFEKLYKDVVACGGEGLMFKRLDWPYEQRGRSKGSFKWKKYKELDGFITGYVPGKNEFSGLVGSLLISVLQDDQKMEVAAVQPGDLGFRNRITDPAGELKDEYYGKVVRIHYLCKTKNKRLRHAVLAPEQAFRTDKTLYDCTEF
ncbi:hypothetical protein LCGC14_1173330 [marine sediment metagenome]|uniref:ATP-dependent DNA ligase family profile domain-containing protein n=1 Tax=marine sediment metagenome TaxID=412755 RepID=A0A0F9LU51_9ZZZZ